MHFGAWDDYRILKALDAQHAATVRRQQLEEEEEELTGRACDESDDASQPRGWSPPRPQGETAPAQRCLSLTPMEAYKQGFLPLSALRPQDICGLHDTSSPLRSHELAATGPSPPTQRRSLVHMMPLAGGRGGSRVIVDSLDPKARSGVQTWQPTCLLNVGRETEPAMEAVAAAGDGGEGGRRLRLSVGEQGQLASRAAQRLCNRVVGPAKRFGSSPQTFTSGTTAPQKRPLQTQAVAPSTKPPSLSPIATVEEARVEGRLRLQGDAREPLLSTPMAVIKGQGRLQSASSPPWRANTSTDDSSNDENGAGERRVGTPETAADPDAPSCLYVTEPPEGASAAAGEGGGWGVPWDDLMGPASRPPAGLPRDQHTAKPRSLPPADVDGGSAGGAGSAPAPASVAPPLGLPAPPEQKDVDVEDVGELLAWAGELDAAWMEEGAS